MIMLGPVFTINAEAAKPSCDPNTTTIIGRVENVVMQDVGMKLKARIDTGAGISSIHAKILEIKPAKGDSSERVVFQLTDDDGKTKTLERPIVKWAEIKGKGIARAIRRPVVRVDFCLGGKRLEGRINLANRGRFLYPVLIGRNILKTGDFLIDPRKKFMENPGCAVK
jgi:hypothetical protein